MGEEKQEANTTGAPARLKVPNTNKQTMLTKRLRSNLYGWGHARITAVV